MKARAWLVFVLALLFHAAGSGSLPLLDRDEPRFAASSRAMLAPGADRIVPHFNGEPRYHKPPLIYWLQAGSMRVFGANEFGARFPSACAAALTATILFLWTRSLASVRTALLAAVIFSFSIHTIVLAKASTADMAMTAFFTALAYAIRNGRKRLAPVLAAVTFLAKGPLAFLPPAAAWIHARIQKRARAVSFLDFAIALAVFAGLVALWAVPAVVRSGGDYVREGFGTHVLGRSLAPMEGHGGSGVAGYLSALPLYFLTIWISFLPFSLWLFRAARYFSKKQNRDSEIRYLITQAIVVFAAFSLVATKLPHYVFPAVPFLSMLVAIYFERSGATTAGVKRAAAGLASAAVVLFLIGFPLLRAQSSTIRLYEAVKPFLSENVEIGCYGTCEPSVIWYLGGKTGRPVRVLQGHEVAPFMRESGAKLVVIPEDKTKEIFPVVPAEWAAARAEGFNPAKGKWVRLAALGKR